MKSRSGKLTIGLAIALLAASPAIMQASTTQAAAPPDLNHQIRHELLMLPYYGVFDNIEFQNDGGVVTLSGQVDWAPLKRDAEQAVHNIAGVRSVVNNIEILPLSRFDDSIRLRVLRAIYGSSTLYRYGLGANPPIHIIVKNGNVTLEGVVANQGDKDMAFLRASGVPDAFNVINDLRVENSKS